MALVYECRANSPGAFCRQPLNQTPNSRIPPSAPILDLPQVRVQRGSGDSTTPLNFDDLLDQIIDDDEEEEVGSENLDGQEVVDSIRSGQTTPVPESSVPLTAETPSNATLGEVLRQLAMVATQLVSASSLAPPRPRPAFRTPEMKKPNSFDGSSPAKLHNYLQQCKLIFRNDIDSFSSDPKKTLYAAAFLTGKAFEWVQPYLKVIDDPPPNYMMNSWLMFESQLVTLYGDPNELRATEYKLDSLTMKDGDHASNYISILDLLAQNTEVFDTLSELIEATLKIDTRHHKRQKERKRENGSQPTQPKKDTSKTTSSSTPSTSRNPSTSKSTSKTPSEITKVLEGGRLMANEKERRAKAALLQNLCNGSRRKLCGLSKFFLPTFTWECFVIDATGNDDVILGYDFLIHWNPDINWSEGLIIPRASLPAAPIKLPSSSPQEPVSLRSLIAMSSNGSLPDDLHPPGNSSTCIPSVVYLASQDESYDFQTKEVLIRSITTGSRQEVFEGDFFDDPPADLETILPTIPLEYHEFASLFSTILADQLPP
ncbi:hypothetical protein H4Q26_008605 [Puccinia striiformis f. sp. tritici PST-130]|nr:hypothetical protein H4Q26_008605 [Puccinia striiformis f. sp. tritici PST-130]